MSGFTDVCDALMDELVTNVAALAGSVQHLYAAWNPEELEADGKRHLAVYPVADSPDTPIPLTMSEQELDQFYAVVYWEPDPRATRQVEDETGAKALLDLCEAVRDRVYAADRQMLAGSERVWYAGTTLPSVSGQVRWFRLIVNVRRIASFA